MFNSKNITQVCFLNVKKLNKYCTSYTVHCLILVDRQLRGACGPKCRAIFFWGLGSRHMGMYIQQLTRSGTASGWKLRKRRVIYDRWVTRVIWVLIQKVWQVKTKNEIHILFLSFWSFVDGPFSSSGMYSWSEWGRMSLLYSWVYGAMYVCVCEGGRGCYVYACVIRVEIHSSSYDTICVGMYK